MVASSVSRRSRYREYALFLRLSADRLDMAVAPGRLAHLRSKVNTERNLFLVWVIIWSILALICVAPLVMLLVAHIDLPAPANRSDPKRCPVLPAQNRRRTHQRGLRRVRVGIGFPSRRS